MSKKGASANETAADSTDSAGGKKIFTTDPLPIIRYLNMALAVMLLIYSGYTILGFTNNIGSSILMSIVFSVYQV